MPHRKSTRKYEISHSIIIDKYRTNNRNRDEISILDHRNKSFRNLQLTEEKVKGKRTKNKTQFVSPTRPKEVKAGSIVENSLDSKRRCLRNRLLSTEISIANKSLSTHSGIKSNQCGSSSDTMKRDIPTKTYRKNNNVSDELDKKKRSGRKKLVSTSNKDSTSKMCNESQKQINVVPFALKSENVSNQVGENKTNGVNVFRGQNQNNKGNIKYFDDIAPSVVISKMNPYVDMGKNQLIIPQVEVQRSQRNIKRNSKSTGVNAPFSSNCQGNSNQKPTPKVSSKSEGKMFVIPPKNVNKMQKIDFCDKAILKSDVKQSTAVFSDKKRSFNRTVTNAGERIDVTTESNSCIQQHQCLKLSYADYISIAQRILKKNAENLA